MENPTVNSPADGATLQGREKAFTLRKFDNLPDGTPDRAKGPVEVIKGVFNDDGSPKIISKHFPGDPQCL